LIDSLIDSFIYSSIHSFIHSFIDSLIDISDSLIDISVIKSYYLECRGTAEFTLIMAPSLNFINLQRFITDFWWTSY